LAIDERLLNDDNLPVTNEEIVSYLKIAYAILKEAQTSINLERLNEIIGILKKDKSRTYTKSSSKAKINSDTIFETIKMLRSGMDISNQQKSDLNILFENKVFFRLALEKKYSDLFTYLLNNEKEMSTSDLSIIYFWLTGQEIKTKKKHDLLINVRTFLSQNTYFDNMDNKFNDKWSMNHNNS
jgi:hypothetical protein